MARIRAEARRRRRTPMLSRTAYLEVADRVMCMEVADSDMQHQVDAEGLEDMMLVDASTLSDMTRAKSPLRLRECNTCATPVTTPLKGSSFATFARVATPWGAGRNLGVSGNLGKFLAGTSMSRRLLVVVMIVKWEGRMWGRGPPRSCDLAARLPNNCILVIVDAATRRKGDCAASDIAPLEPKDATRSDLQEDRSPGPR